MNLTLALQIPFAVVAALAFGFLLAKLIPRD